MFYIIIIIAFILLFLFWYIKVRNSLKNQILNQLNEKYNTKREELEKSIQQEEQQLRTDLNNRLYQSKLDLNYLQETKKKTIEDIQEKQAAALEQLQALQTTYNNQKSQLDSSLIQYKQDQQTLIHQEILEWSASAQQAANEDFLDTKSVLDKQIQELRDDIESKSKVIDAFNELMRLQDELDEFEASHSIQLNEASKQDIEYLLSIEEYIHNKELLHKLIWSEYLQKPFNQMLQRVFGAKIPRNVIYCIENKATKKKYIGKTAADVNKRWTEHIKSSLNIGTISHQYIHEALYKHWDEFVFSILEVVTTENLGEREKYYIKLFNTDKYGYNLKGGG